MGLGIGLLQAGWLTSQLPAARRFRVATRDVRTACLRRYQALLPLLAESDYGRAVGLCTTTSPEDFRRRVPVIDYDGLSPWVARVAAGQPRVLSTEPVEMLERTGGSSGAEKLVPYTARLRAEFAEAVGAWMVDLHRQHPGLLGTASYWSVSRAVRAPETTAGGLRVGFDQDAEYFGPLARRVIGRLMAVPAEVARSPSMEAWRRATCLALLARPDLGLISVWSPTFLLRLLEWMAQHLDDLAASLDPAGRRRLERAWAGGRLHGPTLWPRLQVISTWADGFAATQVQALAAPFPGVHLQPKGLLATEGVVSFPVAGGDPVLAVTSHLLELREVGSGRILWPGEVQVGGRYQPLLTTGGGLCRYALPDEVEVTGHLGQVPRIRLIGRLDKASDMVGEKLTATFVRDALCRLGLRAPAFAMLLPRTGPLCYELVVDGGPLPSPDDLDRALSAAPHYAYARELGQLAAPRVQPLPGAWGRWEAALEAHGLSLGDQKPDALEIRPAIAAALLPDHGAPDA